jgi:hypothetical protein
MESRPIGYGQEAGESKTIIARRMAAQKNLQVGWTGRKPPVICPFFSR